MIQRLSLATRSYGYRRITAQLHQQGWAVNHKRVVRLLREDNLLCLRKTRVPCRPRRTAGTAARCIRTWRASWCRPTVNQLWVADITYVRLSEAFVYLAVVLDAFSRRAIGWSLADHLRAELAVAALTMALASREVVAGALVHHSDRGVQYACGDYIAGLEQAGIQPSMSRVGCPWDNAMAESFMATLKREEVDGCDTATSTMHGRGSARSSRRSTTASACTRRWITCRRLCSRRTVRWDGPCRGQDRRWCDRSFRPALVIVLWRGVALKPGGCAAPLRGKRLDRDTPPQGRHGCRRTAGSGAHEEMATR